ncbi:MAG: carboxypeptidase-like regulatory domain-containing protein, partial [Ignavibacteria bacterium]|nr:carboxypeptidase-like regulatory domain-containing protein [Ignavibacteria bacterium]
MKHYVIIFLVTILLGGLSTTISQRETYFGSIKGKIVDFETKQTLPGVNIILKESSVGTSSNLDGEYEIPHLKIGSYSLVFSFIGYEKIIVPDIIIRSDRITYVNVELRSTAIDLQSVEVTGGYFNNTQQQQLSAVSFSFEEIRRAPGAGGDVSRIIFGLPSLAKINDTKNSLIVRGGSPVENGFFVDNIEIPNINHFPVQGSSEGPIGIINVDLIDNVNFYSGGFGSNYGNKLSSIMEIKFREGNRSTNDVQLDMSMQGFGGVFEGPINAGRGSFVISARRSYLDLVLDLMNENVGLPVYSDIQGKVVYDISDNDKLSIIDIFSYDQQKMNQNDAAENHNNVFIDYKYYTNTAGINWQRLWGTLGYSNTSISHTFAKTDGRFIQTRDAKLLLNNLSDEHEIKFRNSNHLILGSNLNLNFGFEYKGIFTKYNQFYNEYQDLLGNKTEALTLNKENTSLIVGAFTGIEW